MCHHAAKNPTDSTIRISYSSLLHSTQHDHASCGPHRVRALRMHMPGSLMLMKNPACSPQRKPLIPPILAYQALPHIALYMARQQ